MVTMAQLSRFEAKVEELAQRIGLRPITYAVELVWMQPDGSIVDGEGTPCVAEHGTNRKAAERELAG